MRSALLAFSVTAILVVCTGDLSAQTLNNPAEPLAAQPGQVQAVTVYRGQALVTRRVQLPDAPGLHELVVAELPAHVVPDSLYAQSDDAEVRSVRFRTRPINQALTDDVRARVEQLDEQLQDTQDQHAALTHAITLTDQQLGYLQSLTGFTDRTVATELTEGVLNAETLASLTSFIFDEQQRLTELKHELSLEARAAQARITELQDERQRLTGSRTRHTQEAVVFVQVNQTNGDLHLNYLVNHATWSPSYNLRAQTGSGSVSVEYQASVHQASGEDWTDIQLTLSTATPSMVATAPTLAPLHVRAVPPAQTGGRVVVDNVTDYLYNRDQLLARQRDIETARNSAISANFGALVEADTQLNEFAQQMAVLDLSNPGFTIPSDVLREDLAPSTIAVAYAIPNTVTMPSRPDAQLIRIQRFDLDAQFATIAIPTLTEQAFTQAIGTNNSGTVLLAGPAISYLDGQFVGHGNLPAVANGEALTLGFGTNTALRAARTLLSRDERISGGNRIVTFTYRLILENFSDQPIQVQLTDRLPHAEHAAVVVELTDPGQPLASSQTDRDGLLQWNVQVPARATADAAYTLDFTFTMELDRQLTITPANTPLQPNQAASR